LKAGYSPAIEALLLTLAQSRRSATAGVLCVVTTREPITDLRSFQTTTAPERTLEHLVPESVATVLWNAGARRAGAAPITANDQELKEASREVQGHALTLQLLGSFLSRAHRGDIRRRALVRFDKADAAVQGGHAFRVMGAYQNWLAQSGEAGRRQLAVLRLLGLFDRPADPDCLTALGVRPAIPSLTEPLTALSDEDWNILVAGLESAGLVKTTPWEPKRVKGFGEEKARKRMEAVASGHDFPLGEPEDFTPPHGLLAGDRVVLDAHPLLRQHFGKPTVGDSARGVVGGAPAAVPTPQSERSLLAGRTRRPPAALPGGGPRV